jgi:Protein of unknown function (DUF4019)
MKVLKTLAALALAAAITALSAMGAEELDTAPAMTAAQAWLTRVDGGGYGDSWDESAALFRESIPKVQWQTALDTVRAPLGAMVTRKIRKATYARVLPNAPEGEYVVIEFDTGFENLPRSTETVTSMREKDGSWKVAGYYIKPAP